MALSGAQAPASAAPKEVLSSPVTSGGPATDPLAGSRRAASVTELEDRAQREGSVRVIVGLDTSFEPEGRLGRERLRAQRDEIHSTRADLFQDLPAGDFTKVRTFDSIPYVALEVSSRGLRGLQRSPHASSISEDVPVPPALADTGKLIGASAMQSIGFDGSGKTIAVLDTGIESTHSFLTGKVVEEACYSSGSDCPNGATSQLGSGSGAPCTYVSICSHGTHVGGIAAGKGAAFSGVANDASLMAVQVFSKFNGEANCGSGVMVCALSSTSDQIAGLQQVYDLRNARDFASVNMSLGGGKYPGTCDWAGPALKAVIDNLRSVGIPTIIAAGNEGYRDGISFPACISSAVSVGSTTKTDDISSFSNLSSSVSLLAPGSSVNSSVTQNKFSSFSGTSMAAPQVAGAWAVLEEKSPTKTVAEILGALQSTGKLVTDVRPATSSPARPAGNVTKPRIRIAAAAGQLSPIANDNFSSSMVLSGASPQHSAHNVGATKETGEPDHGGPDNPGGSSIWYRWTAPFSATATIDTVGSGFDTLLSVYTGGGVGSLSEVAGNDDQDPANSVRTSSVQFSATEGTVYRIAVDGYNQAQGPTTIRLAMPETGLPSNPTIDSSSHTLHEWSNDRTIDVEWTGASDGASGVGGYSTVFDQQPNTTPDTEVDFPAAQGGTTSSSRPDGDAHYFHLRTVDVAGNWSGAVHLGPFYIDATAPEASGMVAPVKRFSKTTDIGLGWTASSDATSGVDGYDVQYQDAPFDGLLSASSPLMSSSGTMAHISGELGHDLCFSVSVRDLAGNQSPDSSTRCTSVPLDDRGLTRNGTWAEKSQSDHFENTYLVSKQKGSSLGLENVHARRLAVLATKCPGCGAIRVLWNGTPLRRVGTTQTTADLASWTTRHKKLIRFQPLPAAAVGTVQIEVVSDNGKPVKIDALGIAKT